MSGLTATIQLKRGRERPVENRHPWIFSGAVEQVVGEPEPGDLVAVLNHQGDWLATAYYNPHSQIRARILSWDTGETIDQEWWHDRLQAALQRRAELHLEPETTAFRLVNAEADQLPGLIVDRYGDFLVLQALTAGIDRHKELLANLLVDLTGATGVVERSDVDIREKEGLPATSGLLHGAAPPELLEVRENRLRIQVDLLQGHKTGLYLDQRDNRALVGQPRFVAGKEVLNVFAYTGGFALSAASAGAATITNVDSSIPALEQAERNMALNGFERPQDEYIAADAFDLLRQYRDSQQQFDVVILDPPKFAYRQRDVQPACRGYKDLNWLAFRLLRSGGLLATFSCSGLVDADLFQKVVFSAAVDAGRDAQILFRLGQAPDHPVLLTFPESSYLKGLVLRVI
jgi:23S rRNA (cytosine1962-C5)-methyltransferase